MPINSGLIFVRHSLPVIDPAIPARAWRLSPEGQQRCRLLAVQLAKFKPRRIVTSIEPKAVETAQIIAAVLGMPYQSAAGLHEHARSQVKHTSQGFFESSVREFFARLDRLSFGDETADQTYTRFSRAVTSTQDRYPGETPLVIVTHGTVISLFAAHTCDVDPFTLWKSLKLPCIVEFSTGKPNIISYDIASSPSPDPSSANS